MIAIVGIVAVVLVLSMLSATKADIEEARRRQRPLVWVAGVFVVFMLILFMF